jgi:hypothetical protein
MKAEMQAAADAASIASISRSSAGYFAATKMTSDGLVSDGVTDANNLFNGNLSATGYANLSVISTVIKIGPTPISSVRFSAQVPIAFMKIVRKQSLTISGSSTASAAIPVAPNNMATQRNGMFTLRNVESDRQHVRPSADDRPNHQIGAIVRPRSRRSCLEMAAIGPDSLRRRTAIEAEERMYRWGAAVAILALATVGGSLSQVRAAPPTAVAGI